MAGTVRSRVVRRRNSTAFPNQRSGFGSGRGVAASCHEILRHCFCIPGRSDGCPDPVSRNGATAQRFRTLNPDRDRDVASSRETERKVSAAAIQGLPLSAAGLLGTTRPLQGRTSELKTFRLLCVLNFTDHHKPRWMIDPKRKDDSIDKDMFDRPASGILKPIIALKKRIPCQFVSSIHNFPLPTLRQRQNKFGREVGKTRAILGGLTHGRCALPILPPTLACPPASRR